MLLQLASGGLASHVKSIFIVQGCYIDLFTVAELARLCGGFLRPM
jgi:hypothetical protein